MATRRQAPTVRLRRLAAELKRLRTEADLTREAVEDKTGINEATLYRIESARVRPQKRTLVSLLELYRVNDSHRNEIIELSRAATEQGWLRPYHSQLPEEYTAYISFEAEASGVRNYESLFIPGLLQTENYADAVIQGVLSMATPREVEQRVQARMERKHVLTKPNPMRLWAIVDEAALRRVVGSPTVMRDQMKHLLEVTAEVNVTLQVIPFSVGAHPGMPGSFVLMSFPELADADVVYIDSMAGDLFLEAPADLQRYGSIFDTLLATALSPSESMRLVETIAHE